MESRLSIHQNGALTSPCAEPCTVSTGWHLDFRDLSETFGPAVAIPTTTATESVRLPRLASRGETLLLEVLEMRAEPRRMTLTVLTAHELCKYPPSADSSGLQAIADIATTTLRRIPTYDRDPQLIDLLLDEFSVRTQTALAQARARVEFLGTRHAYNQRELVDQLVRLRQGLSRAAIEALATGVRSTLIDPFHHTVSELVGDIQALTLLQLANLSDQAARSAERESESARERAHNELRLASLGAATLFPLLFLALLGANVIPESLGEFEVQSLEGLAVAAGVSTALGIIGVAWARKGVR